MNTIHLTLKNLSCSHCVANVEKALTAFQGVEKAEVTLTSATVTTDLTAEKIIQIIELAGYEAALANEESRIVCLELKDLSCQHCVTNVQKALTSVSGVTRATVSLTHAEIEGTATVETLIKAVQEAGYGATFCCNKEEECQKICCDNAEK